MKISASRAFLGMIMPGLVVSMLVSTSAVAASTHGAGEPNAAARTAPKATMQRTATHPTRDLGRPVSRQEGRTARARAHASARLGSKNVIAPVAAPLARIIRKVSLRGVGGTIDKTLIDDGTLWRQNGSLATWQQTGVASWYGGARWQGHQTSSGSRFDQNALTAAHATLPLGTKVLVVRNDGRRSVVVTINDRPGTRTRIIDLSRAAAKELGILDAGTAMVTLQPL